MKERFAESEFLYGVPEKLGGAICMHYDEANGRGEFLWTHTTSSMGIAFQTTADEVATTRYVTKILGYFVQIIFPYDLSLRTIHFCNFMSECLD